MSIFELFTCLHNVRGKPEKGSQVSIDKPNFEYCAKILCKFAMKDLNSFVFSLCLRYCFICSLTNGEENLDHLVWSERKLGYR